MGLGRSLAALRRRRARPSCRSDGRLHREVGAFGGNGEASVVGDQCSEILAKGEGRSEVDCIERSHRRRLDRGRGGQGTSVDVHQGNPSKDFTGSAALGRPEPRPTQGARHLSEGERARNPVRVFSEKLHERHRFWLTDDELHQRRRVEIHHTHGRSSRSLASARLARRDERLPRGAPRASRSPTAGVARPAATRRSRAVDFAPAGARTATRCPRSFTSKVSPFLTRLR